MKVDGIKILVKHAALAGITLLWFNFNQTVFYVVRDIIVDTYNEMKDSDVDDEDDEDVGEMQDSDVDDEDVDEMKWKPVKKVVKIVKTYNEMQDSPVEPERYPAEEPGYDEDAE